MRLGAHVHTHGSLPNAVDAALALGCETLQVFVSNPRAWAAPTVTAAAAGEFRERRREAGLGPVFAHSSYVVNIASADEGMRRRSVDLARWEMDALRAIGGDGLVVHAGAGGPRERRAAVHRAALSVLAIAAHEGPALLLELTAGGAGTVASTIPEAARLLEACDQHPGVGLVIDTAHLFAAGAPLDTPTGAREALADLRRYRVTRRLHLVHANDAKDPRGSRRDRHEHIGRGFIGDAGFRAILTDPAVRRLPVVIETPGRAADDRRNLARLRRLASG